MKTRRHFILGGMIKAAASSLFSYFDARPEIYASRGKESCLFSLYHRGDAVRDKQRYLSYFTPGDTPQALFEASPETLGNKEKVAPEIGQLLPKAKLPWIFSVMDATSMQVASS